MSGTFIETKQVPTTNGPRSGDDIVNELFILARTARTETIDGAAFMCGWRDGEHIEIRVTVKTKTYAEAVQSAAGSTNTI